MLFDAENISASTYDRVTRTAELVVPHELIDQVRASDTRLLLLETADAGQTLQYSRMDIELSKRSL
jgi:hypothetical protein